MPPDSPPPPGPPYRSRWSEVERIAHPETFTSANDLLNYVLQLRARVDAGTFGEATPEALARAMLELAQAREWLRRRTRPVRAGLVAAAGFFGGSGLLITLAHLGYFGHVMQAVAFVVAVVAALASEAVHRWVDVLPEYDGLIGDLRKMAEKARGSDVSRAPSGMDEELLGQADALEKHMEQQRRAKEEMLRVTELVRNRSKVRWGEDEPDSPTSGVRVALPDVEPRAETLGSSADDDAQETAHDPQGKREKP